jgi:hypothetical protein
VGEMVADQTVNQAAKPLKKREKEKKRKQNKTKTPVLEQ